jgi:hypothetical protein
MAQVLSYVDQIALGGRGGGVSRLDELDTAILRISSDSFQ